MKEPIKESKNVEFDVIYDDGTRHRVREGVLFEAEVESDKMNIHIGTNRVAVLFAVAEALTEFIVDSGLGEAFKTYIESYPKDEEEEDERGQG